VLHVPRLEQPPHLRAIGVIAHLDTWSHLDLLGTPDRRSAPRSPQKREQVVDCIGVIDLDDQGGGSLLPNRQRQDDEQKAERDPECDRHERSSCQATHAFR
jgi:hypothetical protein